MACRMAFHGRGVAIQAAKAKQDLNFRNDERGP